MAFIVALEYLYMLKKFYIIVLVNIIKIIIFGEFKQYFLPFSIAVIYETTKILYFKKRDYRTVIGIMFSLFTRDLPVHKMNIQGTFKLVS